jgi:hypothetical protein
MGSLECRVPLAADDSFAVEAAVAKFFAHLTYLIRLNDGLNARSDRASARNLWSVLAETTMDS